MGSTETAVLYAFKTSWPIANPHGLACLIIAQAISSNSETIETAVSKSSTDVSLQIGLPSNVTIGQDLTVNRNLTVTGKQVLGSSGTANLYLGNEIAANSANKGARFHSDNNDFFMDFQGDATQLWTLRDYDGSGGIHDRFIFNG